MSKNNRTSVEIERKYIIAIPDREILASMPSYTKSRITQDYLMGGVGVTHRVRAREWAGKTCYYETIKRKIDFMSAEECEREISGEEYCELLKLRDPSGATIEKVRHTFLYEGQLFEIDVYPNWTRTCIMETELTAREQSVVMPPFIKIVADVTGMREYSNASMAKSFPRELDF